MRGEAGWVNWRERVRPQYGMMSLWWFTFLLSCLPQCDGGDGGGDGGDRCCYYYLSAGEQAGPWPGGGQTAAAYSRLAGETGGTLTVNNTGVRSEECSQSKHLQLHCHTTVTTVHHSIGKKTHPTVRRVKTSKYFFIKTYFPYSKKSLIIEAV